MMLKSGFLITATLGVVSMGASSLAQNNFDRHAVVCRSNCRVIGLGMLMYTKDWDDYIPPTRSPAAFEKALFPYVKSKPIFLCPASNTLYVPVPALGGKKLKKMKSPATTVVFRCPRPHPNGVVYAGYADGRARLMRPPTSKRP